MIRLENVTKAYDNGPIVLANVDLEVAPGEIFGIIGRSGAGKSTLVRLLNGLERPSSGSVRVDGIDVGELTGAALRKLRGRIGMIFQHFGLLSSRTVAENVALPLKIAGANRAQIAAKLPGLLARVGLQDLGGRYPSQLSGGQKQRIGIARALATDPDILLCDEATSALDPETTRSILDLIAEINRELGLTVVLITHEMEVVRQVCDRVAVLHAGRVVETGRVADVFLDPVAAETRAMLGAADKLPTPADFAGTVVRVTLLGTAADRPVLSEVARETGADIVLLDGRLGRFREGAFSQLVLGLSGDNVDAAVAALRRHGDVHA